jgi:hypothetical protein
MPLHQDTLSTAGGPGVVSRYHLLLLLLLLLLLDGAAALLLQLKT